MSQRLVTPVSFAEEASISIGICAVDRAANLGSLLRVILNEPLSNASVLKNVIVVASGCDPRALTLARDMALRDERVELIVEPVRRGKSEAINQIINRFSGQFLVLVNSDALPEPGAISKLLQMIAQSDNTGIVSASPIVREKAGITGSVLRLIWELHNKCLTRLNVGNLNNRCCDELLVVRSDALRKLPSNIVNDGAFLAGNAHLAGYSIKFCEAARVKIDLPHSVVDLMRQRRRIVYGHLQIWKSVGQSPKTLESMLVNSPLLSLSVLVETLAMSPRLILGFPIALMGEAVSSLLAIYDSLTSTSKHVMWKRFGDRS